MMVEDDGGSRARLIRRLEGLDAETLARVESLLAGEGRGGEAGNDRQAVTRRQLVQGAALGGASLLVGSMGGGALGAAWGDAQGAARAQARADEEIRQLKGLISLYEELEKIGIDAVVGAGIAAAEKGLGALKESVLLLRKAVDLVDSAVGNVEGAIPALRSGLGLADGFVSLVKGQLSLIQTAVLEATGKLSPAADAVGGLLSELVSRIPFGVGQKILEANRRIGELVGGLPNALEAISQQLLAPLRTDWLSEEEGKGLKGLLLTPLRRNLLKPLGSFLDDVVSFLAGLEGKLITPGKTVLGDREKVRQRIVQYRASLGMA
ncbi:MAG: hypothetical protein Q8O07_01800 [Chloroflexota bacterium]|nr:hypothetical protein [Chloroflexota bacterium]